MLIYNIQLLRAFAAAAVAYRHMTSPDGLGLDPSFGRFGVDIFFVISGFIIGFITRQDPSHFALKRVIRIVPTYWSATLALFLVALVLPGVLNSASADPTLLVHSLFFVPYQGSNGMAPLLELGWTLNFEMYFYLVFGVALIFTKSHTPLLASILLLCVLFVFGVLGVGSEPVRYYLGNPLLLEFIGGLALFSFYSRFRFSPSGAWRPVARGMLVATMLLAGAAIIAQEVKWGGLDNRHLLGGLPALVIVGCAIYLERDLGMRARGRVVGIMGESSYVLYLVHPFIIYGAIRLLYPDAGSAPELHRWVLGFLLLTTAIVIAALLHLVVERPVLKRLRRALVRPAPVLVRRVPNPAH